MKVIKYKMEQCGSILDVVIGYNDTNLETAKKEAYNGEYAIVEEANPNEDV